MIRQAAQCGGLTLLLLQSPLVHGKDWQGDETPEEAPSSAPLTQQEEVAPDTRDAEIFGEPLEPDSEGEDRAPVGDAPSRDEAILGSSTATSDIVARLTKADDTLKIGGLAFLRASYSLLDHARIRDTAITSPNFVDLYLDSRPSEKLRFFAKGRLLYDPGAEEAKATTSLDQLWINANSKRRLFVTLGKQRIKWGTGRFWNPTDFLNSETLDSLSVAVLDERLGVPLVKLHLPLESTGTNLYAILSLDDTKQVDEVGGALRAEVVAGTSELSATLVARQGTPLRIGMDYSGALGPFDLKFEAGIQRGLKAPFYRGTLDTTPLRLDEFQTAGLDPEDLPGVLLEQLPAVLATRQPQAYSREKEFLPQIVVGFEYARNYSESDAVYVGAEYFYNDLGYPDARLYPVLIQNGLFRPFYAGRHYAGLYVYLPSPGSWNDTSFTASGLANLSDRSVIPRLDYSVQILTYLNLNAFVMGHLGSQGEFNYSYSQPPLLDPQLAALIPPEAANDIPAEVIEGVQVRGPLLTLGIGVRTQF